MEPVKTFLRGGEGWPSRLASIPRPPERLRVRGVLSLPGERTVAIVGSRRPDAYGRQMASEISKGLAKAGICIVSGGAEGIDAVAHEAALDVGGRTVAVFGAGLDVVYPAAHRPLFQRIVRAGGALVSEYDDGMPPARWTFPERNRIVSGLSEAVVVVRAGEKSGALITAAWARKQSVPVLAVPGDVREEGSAGPIALLRSGARMAANARDVLDTLGLAEQLTLPVEGLEPVLEGDEAALWRSLGRMPVHADELAHTAGLQPSAALSGLLLLELRGLCEQRPGHYFSRRS